MNKKSLVIIILALFLVGFASAKISISDVNPIYNFGDKIYITVNLVPANTDGNFEINLNCGNNSINLYKVPAEASFALGTEQKVTTYVVLSQNIIPNSGTCFLESSLGSEKIQTKTFTITDSIIITAQLDKISYDPAETISLDIDATKANGQLLDGFVEVSGAAEFSKAISKGVAQEKFAMPETTAAGTYSANIFVYDKKGELVLNKANTTVSFKINQVPKSLITSIDKTELDPADNITLGAELLDQAGQKIDSEVSYVIVAPNKSEINFVAKTGSFIEVPFEFNATPGKWLVFSSSLGVNDQKEFTVNAIQKVTFEFVNGTSVLVVKNIGNSIYNDVISIDIGGNKTQNLSLLGIGIGEERKFSLNAPDGEYEVSISDNKSFFQQKVALTGKSISIQDFRGAGIFSKYPIIWLFLALILAAAAIVSVIRYFRKKTFKHGSLLDSKNIFPSSKKASEMDKGFVNMDSKVSGAESSMVVKGNRTNSAIVAIKFSGLTHNSKPEVEKILAIAKLKKGLVEWNNQHAMVIFAPQVTKSQSNEWLAAKFAYDISRQFLDYNKRAADKISFNIGIHSGDLIGSVEGGRFKYTGVGGTVVLAKRIADSNTGKVLISENARRSIMKDLRGQKTGEVNGKIVFEITGVADREGNQGKLDDLLKRMGK